MCGVSSVLEAIEQVLCGELCSQLAGLMRIPTLWPPGNEAGFGSPLRCTFLCRRVGDEEVMVFLECRNLIPQLGMSTALVVILTMECWR